MGDALLTYNLSLGFWSNIIVDCREYREKKLRKSNLRGSTTFVQSSASLIVRIATRSITEFFVWLLAAWPVNIMALRQKIFPDEI